MTARERTYTWSDPFEVLGIAAGLSPLAYLEAVVAGELPQAPMAATLGFRLAEVSAGRAVFEAVPAEWHYNPIGTVHGGLALALLDSAMGCAFVASTETPTRWTTLELKVNFTRAMTAETGVVRCAGEVVHAGRRIVTTEGRIVDSADRLLAHGTSTLLIAGD